MKDFIEAVDRLYEQLADAEIPAVLARATLDAYRTALLARTDETWRAFYLSVYAQLRWLTERALPFAGSAALPLLALIEDDLGVGLVPAGERRRIRHALVETTVYEASLSS
jgi:hypothetical protein